MDSEVQENEVTYSPELIQQAKDMGWVEKAEWRGSPEHWRGPDEYVRRGQEVLPIVRSQLERAKAEQLKREEEFSRKQRDWEDRVKRHDEATRTLQARLEAQEREFADRTERNEKMARIALERQRQTFLEQIDAAKFNAVSAGDSQTYAGLIERERQFYRDIQREDEQYQAKQAEKNAQKQNDVRDTDRTVQHDQSAQQQTLSARDQRVRDEWIDKNPWFLRSNELNTEAQKIHMELWETHPGLDLAQNLDRVTEELKRRHPEKFGIEARQEQNKTETNREREKTASHSFVEGASSGPALGNVSSRRKGWSDIHPDDRALAERAYIKTGYYGKDANKAREEYAKDYWEANGE